MPRAVPIETKKCRRRSRFLPPQVDSSELSRGLFGREEPKEGKRNGVIPHGDPRSSSRFCPAWYFVDLDRENQMPDEAPSPTLDTELTTNIVAAYVRPQPNWGGPTVSPDLNRSSGARRPRQTSSRKGDRADPSRADQAIRSSRLYRLPRLWLARPDAQTASRYRPRIDCGTVSRAVEPAA
jgi:hypothetical protein